MADAVAALDAHGAHLRTDGRLARRRSRQRVEEVLERVRAAALDDLARRAQRDARWQAALAAAAAGDVTPEAAAAELWSEWRGRPC